MFAKNEAVVYENNVADSTNETSKINSVSTRVISSISDYQVRLIIFFISRIDNIIPEL